MYALEYEFYLLISACSRWLQIYDEAVLLEMLLLRDVAVWIHHIFHRYLQ